MTMNAPLDLFGNELPVRSEQATLSLRYPAPKVGALTTAELADRARQGSNGAEMDPKVGDLFGTPAPKPSGPLFYIRCHDCLAVQTVAGEYPPGLSCECGGSVGQ